jgi:hypothetical protein
VGSNPTSSASHASPAEQSTPSQAQYESTFEDKLIGKSLRELRSDCQQCEVSDCVVMSTANLLDQVGQGECVAPERLGESWTR